MGPKFKSLEALVWLSQAGLSVIVPPVLFIWGAAWLRDRFSLGGWVLGLGIVLGILGAVGGLINTFRTLNRLAARETPPPEGFNDHD